MTYNDYDTLMLGLLCIFLVWYARYHWSRRRLYQLAAKRQGPRPLPFIGNALDFIGSTSDFLKSATLLGRYESGIPVWFGQKLFFGIYDPVHLEVILNSPHALEKEELYKHHEVLVGTGLLTAPVSKWKKHRKIIMPTFNQKLLDKFVEVFSKQSEILCVQLENGVGQGTINIFDYVSRCTLDMICVTAMGITVNAQTTGSEYMKWANKTMKIIYQRAFVLWYNFDFIFNRTALAEELHSTAKKMMDFTRAIIKEKREAYHKTLEDCKMGVLIVEEPRKRNTFLQRLLELSEEGTNLTDDELLDEVNTLMLAGSDTTATVNSFIILMLAMFPDIQEKIYQEATDVLGPDRLVECNDLGKLHYLERVIKETMRLKLWNKSKIKL